MEIRIWDRGQPFDLEDFLRQLGQRDTRFSGHGQGLPILQKIAAHLSYQRSSDQRNCLLIVKNFLPQNEGVARRE
jgi:serine/threonine-protein kinase RsbW